MQENIQVASESGVGLTPLLGRCDCAIRDLERNGHIAAADIIRELLAMTKLRFDRRCFVKGCRNKATLRYNGSHGFSSCAKHQDRADETVRDEYVAMCPVCSCRFGA